jgi:molybdopterin synthase catalytic subunit
VGSVHIDDTVINLAVLVEQVADTSVGAIATFLGTVRDLNDGRAVHGIDYEAYEPMATREMGRIVREAETRWSGVRVAVQHRVGTLQLGDASVAIACAHARRAPSIAAMQYVIEELKVRVPIWKREHYVDGNRAWVDPTRSAAVPL